MGPWLLFGILLADLWSRFGLLFRPLSASSLNGNLSSLNSMIWYCFWCHFEANLLNVCDFLQNCKRSFGSFCVYFFFSMFSVLSFFSFLSCFLFAGYFGRASAAKRSEAAAGWMSGWMDGWLDGLLDGCPLPLLLPFPWLASSGVRAQRSGARPLLAGCLDGCLDGWLDGLLDGCLLPLFHFIVLSVFACSGFYRFWVDFGTPF